MIAIGALFWAYKNDSRTGDLSNQIEERESAPVLAPDVNPELQGKPVKVPTSYGTVEKPRAERLFVNPDLPQIIMPVRNVGAGLAVIPATLSFQPKCPPKEPIEEPPVLKDDYKRYVGPYNIPSGESRQLGFAPLKDDDPQPFIDARTATKLNLMVVYTDLLGRRLRWTCVTYTRPEKKGAWALEYPYYGDQTR